jgi:hypothetical protein
MRGAKFTFFGRSALFTDVTHLALVELNVEDTEKNGWLWPKKALLPDVRDCIMARGNERVTLSSYS